MRLASSRARPGYQSSNPRQSPSVMSKSRGDHERGYFPVHLYGGGMSHEHRAPRPPTNLDQPDLLRFARPPFPVGVFPTARCSRLTAYQGSTTRSSWTARAPETSRRSSQPWMEPEADTSFYLESVRQRNMIDKVRVQPQTAAIESRCLHNAGDLWNAPDSHATIGTSADRILGGVHARGARVQAPLAESATATRASRPTRRTSCSARACRWCGRSFANYWEVERGTCRSPRSSSTSHPKACSPRWTRTRSAWWRSSAVTYNGVYEPVKELATALDDLQARTGLDVPLHVDAASGVSSRRSSTGSSNGTSACRAFIRSARRATSSGSSTPGSVDRVGEARVPPRDLIFRG